MRRATAGAVALAFVALLLGCSSSNGGLPAATTFEEATERGPLAVGVTTLELVDPSRPTEANREYPGADERRFTVEVWYPADAEPAAAEARDAPLDTREAPYPLIIFAHGLSSGRLQSTSYTQHLASHGYVIVSPDFPLSGLRSPGGPRLAAVINQPGDVSFLIDRFLELSETSGDRFEGALDAEVIGVTGHSLGGLTTLLTVYGDSRDDRVKAALPIAAPACFLGDDIADEAAVPILVLGASEDLLVNRASARHGYDVANAPRYLVELQGADHVRFADLELTDAEVLAVLPREGLGGGSIAQDAAQVAGATGGNAARCLASPPPAGVQSLSSDRQRALLRAFATPFFDAYLRDQDAAKEFLERELPGLVSEAAVETDPP